MYEKYFSPLVKYSVAYLFMPLFYYLGSALVTVVYALLSDIAPSLFPVYNQVLEKESYLAFRRVMDVVSAFVTVFLVNYIIAINDNSRYERVVTRTDALYRVPDELPRYLRDTLPSDAIASLVPQLVFLAFSAINFHEKFESFTHGYLSMHITLLDSMGFFVSFILIAITAFVSRVAAAPAALRKYRGAWLTSFVDS